jgi:hypothetical protein
MQAYHEVGGLPYSSWQDFVKEFVAEFCPKNEIQNVRTNLEISKYFQGLRTIDEYVDEFCKMIDCTCYFEGTHIILKFCQGLNTKIQDHVACMTHGRPATFGQCT